MAPKWCHNIRANVTQPDDTQICNVLHKDTKQNDNYQNLTQRKDTYYNIALGGAMALARMSLSRMTLRFVMVCRMIIYIILLREKILITT
jgi:hypothetical protein